MQVVPVRPKAEGQKTACVVRYGAWGDAIMCAPVFRYLHNDGYHVVANITPRCHQILKTNPYIDEFLLQETDEIQNDTLGDYWQVLEKRYDRFINLSGSIEGALLKVPGVFDPLTGQEEYRLPKHILDQRCNYNYFDYTMSWAGYPDAKGLLGEMYFLPKEEAWAEKWRQEHAPAGKSFLVVIGLGGSAAHKAYPFMEAAMNTVLDLAPEALVVTVGDGACQWLEWDHPRVIKKCMEMGIRKSMALAAAADLVISPETAIANVAGCFDKAKIILLSHSSEENLTKYWKNCVPVYEKVHCYPCHKLHYELDCPLVKDIRAPICMGLLKPEKVIKPTLNFYEKWKTFGNATGQI